jgi:hypothetical protein
MFLPRFDRDPRPDARNGTRVAHGPRPSVGRTSAGCSMGMVAFDQREAGSDRRAYTFHLDPGLVEQARREVGEPDVIRSIEAALAAAIDYHLWIREVSNGRDVLS